MSVAARPTVMVVGESWVTHSVHQKGFDSFTTTTYEEGIGWLAPAIEAAGYELRFVPNHLVATAFPTDPDELARIDAILLSDVGANTLLLGPATFERSERAPNKLELLRDYVAGGGGLGMVGGYLSFQGIDGKANFRNTVLHEVLPAVLPQGDDRVEAPQGLTPRIVDDGHAVTAGLPQTLPEILGYNRFAARDGATVLATVGEDPFLVVGTHGSGRTLAYATDCGPHWAPQAFVTDASYDRFWAQAIGWLAGAQD
ncbi:glutamine amidotransferase [Conexibacter sp. CPCC 206217]|uniref:glutamine amidotransferase n=1 Tax=Conexibacter sp. CPCC 206217 TaxID=3064574 RepID=UPI002717082E|nr:glutamine amidotransferase [Conexibacter sp. CPCC 206217]MDO8208844.1 glutamine amidotransferase [Conexibacter sp. CPCC 206217]